VIIARTMEKAMTWIRTKPESPLWAARRARMRRCVGWGMGLPYLPARTTAWVSIVNGVSEATP
jgi:hypothetical protein